jgi:hypothetical protein
MEFEIAYQKLCLSKKEVPSVIECETFKSDLVEKFKNLPIVNDGLTYMDIIIMGLSQAKEMKFLKAVHKDKSGHLCEIPRTPTYDELCQIIIEIHRNRTPNQKALGESQEKRNAYSLMGQLGIRLVGGFGLCSNYVFDAIDKGLLKLPPGFDEKFNEFNSSSHQKDKMNRLIKCSLSEFIKNAPKMKKGGDSVK